MGEPWEVIYTYTRAQALADGVLVDATEPAREAGFGIPVALSAEVWGSVIEPLPRDQASGQSPEGRLWDVLVVLRFLIAAVSSDPQKARESQIFFDVDFVQEGRRRTVALKAIVGPGDEGEPVLTVLLPHED